MLQATCSGPPTDSPSGMAEMPTLPRLDEASDEFTVDKLGAFASGTTSTAHPALRHERCQPPSSPAMVRAGVPRLGLFPPEQPAAPTTESLVLRDGHELVPAVVAPTLPEVLTPRHRPQDGWPCSSHRPTGSRGPHRTLSSSGYRSLSR